MITWIHIPASFLHAACCVLILHFATSLVWSVLSVAGPALPLLGWLGSAVAMSQAAGAEVRQPIQPSPLLLECARTALDQLSLAERGEWALQLQHITGLGQVAGRSSSSSISSVIWYFGD